MPKGAVWSLCTCVLCGELEGEWETSLRHCHDVPIALCRAVMWEVLRLLGSLVLLSSTRLS